MSNLEKNRQDVLEHVSENYDFGDIMVEAMDGWRSEEPGTEYIQSVYLENLVDKDGDSELVYLKVIFESNESANIKEVYAIDKTGNIFGSYEP